MRYIKNEYIERDNFTELIINTKKYGKNIILLDAKDVSRVRDKHWYVYFSKNSNNFYVKTSSMGRKEITIHRLIMDCPKGMVVDHINRDTFDNRKQNLRICTNYENLQNKNIYKNSKIKYVYEDKTRNKYIVKICGNKKSIFLGRYKDINEAINIRDNYLKEKENGRHEI